MTFLSLTANGSPIDIDPGSVRVICISSIGSRGGMLISYKNLPFAKDSDTIDPTRENIKELHDVGVISDKSRDRYLNHFGLTEKTEKDK